MTFSIPHRQVTTWPCGFIINWALSPWQLAFKGKFYPSSYNNDIKAIRSLGMPLVSKLWESCYLQKKIKMGFVKSPTVVDIGSKRW